MIYSYYFRYLKSARDIKSDHTEKESSDAQIPYEIVGEVCVGTSVLTNHNFIQIPSIVM